MTQSFEKYIQIQLDGDSLVAQAMRYAMQGGKLVRAQLLLSLLEDYGIDRNVGYASASAIEMIHSYSLIHDDLPAMDDDDYRRGQLAVHKKFGEATAILAGDALLTKAFFSAINPALNDNINLKILQVLSIYSGKDGMILGQEKDLAAENKEIDIEQLLDIHRFKTGKLITAPLLISAIIAEKEDEFPILLELGENIGLLFQVQDDIFDVTKTDQELGKSLSDLKNHKNTSVSLLGLAGANKLLEDTYKHIKQLLQQLSVKPIKLSEMIEKIYNRTH